VVASTLDATKVKSVDLPAKPNDQGYLSLQSAQLFSQGMSFSGNERDKFWLNRGLEGFVDLSDVSGADSLQDGRAAVAADFDDDGDVDLFVHHIQRERHGLLRNDIAVPGGPTNRFLKIRLRATRSQHEAIGAIVLVKTSLGPVAQVLARGSGFASCLPPELVFGLGTAAEAEVEVIWPGARRESFGVVQANTRALLVEGEGRAQAIPARPRPLPDPVPSGLRIAEGESVPVVSLVDREGRSKLLDVRALAVGKPLFLNFWASWCAPCVAELPTLQRLADRGEVRVVTVGLDAPRDRERAVALLGKHAARIEAFFLPEVADPEAPGVEAIVDLERLPIPTTLVITSAGRVESVLRGPIRDDR
jgi:thiol-disulfide isomerase/thioredoxin